MCNTVFNADSVLRAFFRAIAEADANAASDKEDDDEDTVLPEFITSLN